MLEESYALNNLGSSALRQRKIDSAILYFHNSASLKQRILDLDKKNHDKRFDLIDTRSWIVSALEAKGNLIEASQGYDEVIKDLRALIGEKKNSNTWKLRLANYLMLSASIEASLRNHKKAHSAAKESVEILTRLTQLEPDNSEWANSLVFASKILSSQEPKKNLAAGLKPLAEEAPAN